MKPLYNCHILTKNVLYPNEGQEVKAVPVQGWESVGGGRAQDRVKEGEYGRCIHV
jgi:hypothetical protein